MSESPDSLTTVDIYNQRYKLRSGGDEETIQKLAEHVDATMKEIARGTPTVDTVRVAILAALTITGDYFAARDELQKIREEVDERTASMLSELRSAQSKLSA